MANNPEYQATINIIQAIDEEKLLIPTNIPVEIYIQEAETLYHWSLDDKENLKAAKFDTQVLDSLPVRTGILREAESRWQLERFGQEDIQKKWNEESAIAYDLRDELLHHFRFAFRKDAELLKKVAVISEGIGHADMFQDLSDLSHLGNDNREKLESISMDMTLLDKAAEISKTLPPVLGKMTSKKGSYAESKKFRDQAYTYLKQAVDEIREYGQYIFWKDDERKKGYFSSHLKKRNVKNAGKKNKTDTNQ